MRSLHALFIVALAVAGCVSTEQERVREVTQDGLHLYRRGAYADARDTFRTALTLAPNDPQLLYHLAACHDRLGQGKQADEYYHACLKHDPDHLESRHALLVRLVESGKKAEAQQSVQTWLRQSPQKAGPYIEDAYLRARDGDLDNARSRLQQALGIEPRHPRAMVELAAIYEKLDRPDRAVVLYERSLETNPEQPAIEQRLRELRARGVRRPRPD